MNIDHIFIFTKPNDIAIEQLTNAGFVEGVGRVHEGQGTANRKFYFENFFLEFIWVINEEEIQSEKIKSMGLWDRANYKHNGYSRFGICFQNDESTDTLFKNAFHYQPDYFPQGKVIEILKHNDKPSLPMMFRLPFKGDIKHNQPVSHTNGVKKLTAIVFQYTDKIERSYFEVIPENLIMFRKADETWLVLGFDNLKQQKTIIIEELNLSIQY